MTVHSHGNFRAMPHWEIRLVHHEPLSLMILTLSQPVPGPVILILSACLGTAKYKSLGHWFDSDRIRMYGFKSNDAPKWEMDAQFIRLVAVTRKFVLLLLLFYAIARVFHLYHGGDMIYEIGRRKPQPTLLTTQGILPHHIGMVWHGREINCSTAKCNSHDWDSYPCPQGHIPRAPTN